MKALLSCGTVTSALDIDEILWCDHSNESYRAVLSSDTDYYAVQSAWFLNFVFG